MYTVEVTFSALEDLAKLPAKKHTVLLKQINKILQSTPLPQNGKNQHGRYRLKMGRNNILYIVKESEIKILAIYQ